MVAYRFIRTININRTNATAPWPPSFFAKGITIYIYTLTYILLSCKPSLRFESRFFTRPSIFFTLWG